MYIDSLELTNIRTFRKTRVEFCNPDRDYEALAMPRPRHPNVNLLLGNNGMGKTTLLRGIALSALGPAARDSGIHPQRLIRREAGSDGPASGARLKGVFHTHTQDQHEGQLVSDLRLEPKGDLEVLEWKGGKGEAWQPIYSARSDSFFFVGYGATRRVEKLEFASLSNYPIPR